MSTEVTTYTLTLGLKSGKVLRSDPTVIDEKLIPEIVKDLKDGLRLKKERKLYSFYMNRDLTVVSSDRVEYLSVELVADEPTNEITGDSSRFVTGDFHGGKADF